MSKGSYREQSNQAKAVREGTIEPRPAKPKTRGKEPRPVRLQERWQNRAGEWREWKDCYRRYADVATAEMAVAQLNRKFSFVQYRLKPAHSGS